MKNLFLTIGIVAAVQATAVSQSNVSSLNSPLVKSYYEKEEGRFHGEYVSWHKNGVKKAEGEFDNNNRVGKWSVWDTAGNLVVERIYENNFRFKQTVPTEFESGFTGVYFCSETFELKGYNYFSLEAKQVVFSSLLWREILPEDNPILFEDNLFLRTLIAAMNSGSLLAYTDEFVSEKNNAKIDNLNNFKLHSIKLKEQYVFDNQRNIGEFYIICFSPVMVNTATNDTITNYWFYFPEAIPVLTKARLPRQFANTSNNLIGRDLGSLLFYRYFYGTITQWEHKRRFHNYGNIAPEQESDLIEAHLIDLEHNLWVESAKSVKK